MLPIAAGMIGVLAVISLPPLVTVTPAHAATLRSSYAMGVRLGTGIGETVLAYACDAFRTMRCLMGYGQGFRGMNCGVQQPERHDTVDVPGGTAEQQEHTDRRYPSIAFQALSDADRQPRPNRTLHGALRP